MLSNDGVAELVGLLILSIAYMKTVSSPNNPSSCAGHACEATSATTCSSFKHVDRYLGSITADISGCRFSKHAKT